MASKKQRDRAKKNITSAVAGGGEINIKKASDISVDIIARSKTSKQRGAAKQERLRRAINVR